MDRFLAWIWPNKEAEQQKIGVFENRNHRDLWGYSNPLLCKMMDQERTRFGGFFTGFEPKTGIETKKNTTNNTTSPSVQPEECLCST